MCVVVNLPFYGRFNIAKLCTLNELQNRLHRKRTAVANAAVRAFRRSIGTGIEQYFAVFFRMHNIRVVPHNTHVCRVMLTFHRNVNVENIGRVRKLHGDWRVLHISLDLRLLCFGRL